MAAEPGAFSVVKQIRQSPPVDLSVPYDPDWVRGKTILITGGAGGFGEGFLRKWAAHGANVIIGDVNVQKGDRLVREVRRETGNADLHYVHCDVVDWSSQVNFFKEAIRLSTHGGIDVVVANAGVGDRPPFFEHPEPLNTNEPAKPSLTTIDVNVTGVLYTAHLALFYLPLNPGSTPADPASTPTSASRDRHLLLLGSIASLAPLPGQATYGVSKHAVLGLFRALRGTSFASGIRVNMLCPYFIDTPIIPPKGRALLAGITMGRVEDVVDAGTRFVADSRIVGRSLVVGPKLRVEQDADGEITYLDMNSTRGNVTAVWEAYAEDYETCDIYQRRMIGLFATAAAVKGWAGYFAGLASALIYTLKNLESLPFRPRSRPDLTFSGGEPHILRRTVFGSRHLPSSDHSAGRLHPKLSSSSRLISIHRHHEPQDREVHSISPQHYHTSFPGLDRLRQTIHVPFFYFPIGCVYSKITTIDPFIPPDQLRVESPCPTARRLLTSAGPGYQDVDHWLYHLPEHSMYEMWKEDRYEALPSTPRRVHSGSLTQRTLRSWNITRRKVFLVGCGLAVLLLFNSVVSLLRRPVSIRRGHLNFNTYNNPTSLPNAAFQPPEPVPYRLPDTVDTFASYKYRSTCNISALDLHAPFSPLCPDRASMLAAMSSGGRIGHDAPYMPRGCDMRWFSTAEICEILSRFSKVIIVGDSMMRHVIGSLNVLLRQDLGYGAVTDWNFSPQERRDCFCNRQFDVKACSVQGIYKTADVVRHDPSSIACPANTVDLMIETMIRFPIPPEESERFVQLLGDAKPEKPYAFIFGHGLWNDLDLRATLSWLDHILQLTTTTLPYLSHPSAFWPRLFLTPNAAGVHKPDEWLVSQGNKALQLFEEAVKVEAGRRGVEHLGTWNMSVQANLFDGVHTDLRGNLVKAMMVLNWLNMLDVEEHYR